MAQLPFRVGTFPLRTLLVTAVMLLLSPGVPAVAGAAQPHNRPADAQTKQVTISTVERNERAYVSAAALGRSAGIAVKALPGQKVVVACSGERCARVEDFIEEGGDILVEVDALAEALGMRAQFDAQRRHVAFRFVDAAGQAKGAEPGATPGVGDVAPDFKLSKLDGTPVSLSDFRGKRVLINSWASW